MNRKQLHQKVAAELEHIPRRERGSPQNLLRQYYPFRMGDLKENPNAPAGESLAKFLSFLQKAYPGFEFQYDREFFNVN